MWLVRLALRRPYSVAILAAAILLLGTLATLRAKADIFPTIDVPIVYVVWNYPKMPAEEMERRIVFPSERTLSIAVDGISRIESRSTSGIGLIKVNFEPGADVGAAIAQISSALQTAMRSMPPGLNPPGVARFNVSNLPVAQITVSSKTLPEQQLYDYGFNFLRVRLFTIPGLASPAPYGGKQRQIVVDIDPRAAAANGLSPADIVSGLLSSNIITPAGAARMGDVEYDVTVNNSPPNIEAFKTMPLKVVGGAVVSLGDVATVADTFAVQDNVVRVNGNRATYLTVIRKAGASTLTVVESARSLLPELKRVAPEGVEMSLDFDQSVFVRAAISGVLREAAISAILVSAMVFAFLGSWRSVIIISTSIPLAILVAVIGLYLTDNTFNLMTLGGFSLAIGMLVDDATVEIENIHRNRTLGAPLTVAILEGARQVATPALAATLTICIVFFPIFLLTGATRSLFVPLGWAVIISMLASYFLSRTLVPVLARMLMVKEKHGHGPLGAWRERVFDSFQNAYTRALEGVVVRRGIVVVGVLVILGVSVALGRIVGTDFFPPVDSGQMRLHVRASPGTRIETTEQLVSGVESSIRRIIPAAELQTITDNIGTPVWFNLLLGGEADNADGADAEIGISLHPDHAPVEEYRRRIREAVATEYPNLQAYFQPADIISQVLNFGLAAAIDVEITGRDVERSMDIARKLRRRIQTIAGAVDVHIAQVIEHPSLHVEVDRIRAAQIGVTQRDVANNVLTSLSSSTTTSPSFWVNPQTGVQYIVAVRTPLDAARTVDDLYGTPLNVVGNDPPGAANRQVVAPYLGSVARISPSQSKSIVTHDNVQRVVDVLVGVEGRDLGSVATDIGAALKELGNLPADMKVTLSGQSQAMNSSFKSLAFGLILAMLLVYGLLAVLYQSWLDPIIIFVAVPGGLAGVIWGLALTGTTLNTESLMGAIMVVGVATSNSILLVNFANDVRVERGLDATTAAIEAGRTRLRPVLMTALAMILGMLPMSLGLGEGGEQNAPLARAVVGGLLAATLMTLFFVPLVYAMLRKAPPTKHRLDARFEAESRGAPAT
jgi:multidrug efflux pump subunit AcrB